MQSFYIFHYFFILVHHHASCAKGNNPRKNLIVEFNPYVSILDRYDKNRYNISELLPLVVKVATEFDHVLMDLKFVIARGEWENAVGFPPKLSSSLLLSPLAVATYNAHRNTSQPKLEVWLAISQTPYYPDMIAMSRDLKYIAEKANDIYEGTVTTMLLQYDESLNKSGIKVIKNENVFQEHIFKRTYKWGLVLSSDYECNRGFGAQQVTELQVDVTVLQMPVDRLHSNLASECRPYKGNNSLTFWFRPQSTTEVSSVSIWSISKFLEQWTGIEKLAERNGMRVVVSSAFDVSDDKCDKGDGWWRLKENPGYSSTSDYMFEAKKDMAEREDTEANLINLEFVAKNEPKLRKEHLGIGFSSALCHDKSVEVEGVPQVVITNYSKIVFRLLDDYRGGITNADELKCCAKYFLKSMDMFIFVPAYFHLESYNTDTLNSILVQPTPNTRQTFILEFYLYFYNNQFNKHNVLFIRNQSSWHAKISFLFPTLYCLKFETLTDQVKTQVVEALAVSDMALFSFYENSSAQYEADKMFQEKLVTFAQCRKFLNKIKSSNSSIGNVEVGFLMGLYQLPSNYYEDANALYNFVLYWDKLREWAVKEETTVIMSGMLDSVTGGRTELGWWRRQSKIEMKRINSTNQWIDKRTDFFLHPDVITQLNKSRERTNNAHNFALSTNNIVTISVSVFLAVVFLISIPICFFAHKYYKRQYLSSGEVNDFFRGNQIMTDTAQQFKLPYDESKFEIEPKRYTIDHSRVLGSGEFGMVCAGKVEKSDGEFVDVAVKMVNSNKYHKSALTGLLSEIKVLAHVGKHENIIELLGAHTAELKRGKIFVFLEQGQCGSLEKYLRNLSPQPNANNASSLDEDGVQLTEMQTMINSADVNLEPITDDLYRWSREICSGMSFLSSKHVVHADLATRNVLLNAEKTAKICDFGLSRRMYNYANYVKQSQEPLPWKWMAPESLRLMKFNEKSDVWAYGVTLWEIYSLGDVPFQGLSFDPNFSRMLEQGFRMGEPKYNDRNMYSTMMMKCWNTNPLRRPSFQDLLLLFGSGERID